MEIYTWTCGTPNPVGKVTTNSEGYYSIGNLGNSKYSIIPEDAGFNFVPEFVDVRFPQAETQSYDFNATAD